MLAPHLVGRVVTAAPLERVGRAPARARPLAGVDRERAPEVLELGLVASLRRSPPRRLDVRLRGRGRGYGVGLPRGERPEELRRQRILGRDGHGRLERGGGSRGRARARLEHARSHEDVGRLRRVDVAASRRWA